MRISWLHNGMEFGRAQCLYPSSACNRGICYTASQRGEI
jgi:hypothetical protein